MKNRFFILVGLLIAEMNLCQGGMTWEEWTPENGIEDGRAALQEMLDTGKMPDENWQEKALAFINAFEKLKLQLQFFWRSQVGDGATIGNPWNGISDGCMWYRAKGFFKRDCPIVLHFWMNGHIGKYVKKVNDYNTEIYAFDMETCVPILAGFSKKDFKKAKRILKKYILNLFKKKDLKACAILLNQNFCRPVSNLIIKTVNFLEKQDVLQKKELELLFRLYGTYNIIDVFEFPILAQENYNSTTDEICTFMANCCYEMDKLDSKCKTWMIDLFRNYNKDSYKEGAGIGQYNLDLTIIIHKLLSKLKMTPKNLDEEFIKVMNVVIEGWQQQLREVEGIEKNTEMLHSWNQACASLHNAIWN